MRRRLALVVLVAATACSGSDPPSPERPRCEVAFTVPSGFEPLSTFEEDAYDDHVGVRVGFVDDDRRELHVLAGIPGEIGEGLPSAGEVELMEGRSGALLGRETVWVVRWEEGDVCDPRAIIGNGFDRPSFLDALAEAGVAATGSSR